MSGYAISTASMWGAQALAPTATAGRNIQLIISRALPGPMQTPMLESQHIARILDVLCADSDEALLRLAERQDERCGGLVGLLLEETPTIAEAVRLLMTFTRLHSEPVYWTGSLRGDYAALTNWIDRPAGVSVKDANRMNVLGILQVVAGYRAILGEAFEVLEIRLQPSALGDSCPREFLGVPIERSSTENEILISRACLTRENPRYKGHQDTHQTLRNELDQCQEALKKEIFRNDICSWIRGHLPAGDCDLTHLANRLNCDKRTLQRRFERELACRFSDLLDEVRAEICLPLVESGAFPMQMIAEQLGYATSGNFSRFFQRRFGCPPSEWSRQGFSA